MCVSAYVYNPVSIIIVSQPFQFILLDHQADCSSPNNFLSS